MNNELFKRVLSTLFLIPIITYIIIEGSIYFNLLIFICFFIALYEWHYMSKKKLYYLPGIVFIAFSFYTVFLLRNKFDDNYLYFFLVLFTCIFTDIGGYVFGKIFKGRKLTKISPNKTFSGMFGGYFLSIILMIIFYFNYSKFTDNQSLLVLETKSYIFYLFFIFIVSSFSQLGDITISYYKRLSKIKDSGKVIPGHGGLLDRIDGMLFAFPMSYFILILIA